MSPVSLPPSINRSSLAHLSCLRVSGVLAADAQLYPTTGQPPHAVLMLQLQPERGLPFEARVDLGTDVADHINAKAELRHLRAGAFVSVAGDGLELRADHGHAALRVVHARDAVVFSDPINPQKQEG